ncbi:MAG: site-specific integrase, partial [Acidaminococcaceae bacterium]
DIYGKAIPELEEKIKKLEYELDRGVTSEKAYFGDYLEKWLNDVHLVNKKPATAKRYRGLLEKYIKGYPISSISLKDLTALDVQSHYARLVKESISKSTLDILGKIINPCIRYAFNQGKILVDFSRSIIVPDSSVQKKEGTRRPSIALLPEQEEKLLLACKDTKWYYFILTALNSGMRRGELLALTWSDVDLNKRQITINKSYSPQSKLGTTKTENSNRKIPIPIFLVTALKKHKINQSEIKLLLCNKYEDNGIVFDNGFGKYIAATSLNRALKKFADEMGIDSLNTHDFRDTYATKLYNQTKDLKMVQTLLGHSEISTTADIYTHVSEAEATSYINVLDKLHNA